MRLPAIDATIFFHPISRALLSPLFYAREWAKKHLIHQADMSDKDFNNTLTFSESVHTRNRPQFVPFYVYSYISRQKKI